MTRLCRRHNRRTRVAAVAVCLGALGSSACGGYRATSPLARTKAPARHGPFLNTSANQPLETWDPRLAAALAALGERPTPAAHRQVAAEYTRLKVLDTAHAHLTEAVRLGKTDPASYDARARLWRDNGFPELGLGDAYRAHYYGPDSPEAANTIGTLFEAIGRLHEALAWYQRAVAIMPGAWFAMNNICHVQIRLGQPGAATSCEAARDAQPTSAMVLNNLALAYAMSGEFERARARFAATADEASAAYNMGIVYMAAGQFQRAAAEFTAAWRANPSMTLAAERLRQATAQRVAK